ncbi:MAG: hypothetical protein ACRD8O_19480 [Bryobacteraceae bacterium]
MTFKTILCAALLVATAAAADISGKWSGDMPARDTTRPVTFNLKADGEKLTGTMSGPQGDIELKDGKVSGDNLSFKVDLNFGGNAITLMFEGKVTGNEMKMTRKREGGQGQDFTLKRAS